MPRPRKNAPEGTSTPNIHRDASLVFARRPDSKRHAITHEILAADLAAFHRDCGTIEVPRTTYTRRKVGQDGKPIATTRYAVAPRHAHVGVRVPAAVCISR